MESTYWVPFIWTNMWFISEIQLYPFPWVPQDNPIYLQHQYKQYMDDHGDWEEY